MRKKIIIICTVLSVLMILDSLNVGHTFLMFYLAGVVPGTKFALSAQLMLSLFALLIGFVLARLTSRFFGTLIDRIPARPRA